MQYHRDREELKCSKQQKRRFQLRLSRLSCYSLKKFKVHYQVQVPGQGYTHIRKLKIKTRLQNQGSSVGCSVVLINLKPPIQLASTGRLRLVAPATNLFCCKNELLYFV